MADFTTAGTASADNVANLLQGQISTLEGQIDDALSAAQGGELSTAEALQLQLEISRWSLTVNMTTQAMKAMHDTTSAVLRNISA